MAFWGAKSISHFCNSDDPGQSGEDGNEGNSLSARTGSAWACRSMQARSDDLLLRVVRELVGFYFPVIQLRGTKTQFSSRLVGCGRVSITQPKLVIRSIEVRPSAWHHQPARMIWTTHHRTCNNGLPCKIVPPAQQTLPLLQIECSQFSAYPKILADVELE
jgi:hypothetical protein